ncbi:MAG: phospholipid carrier-dependent glycosyltransferase, partial [Chloroflexi bacterium]|nr:phospholipid carrier-dependent glycosyltransferase [Chloroflexota bacterium]
DWQAPDEPAHYNYVRQLANGRFPIMAQGDYDEAYKNEVVSSGFAPQYAIDSITYEDWQPPLYYLLQTPVFWLTNGSLLAMRLFSVLLGGGVVALAYALARRMFPDEMQPAWGTAVFVAFLPQHIAIMASVNNDALAELIIAAILLLLIRNSQFTIHYSLLGILLGLGFLTKGTVYPLTAVISLTLLWQFWG